jgi:mRNA-degrading endonuclease RelE of RelBE toxin-antitoxin system
LEAAILRLDEHPARSPVIPEDRNLRHLLYGRGRHVYRIIYAIDERRQVVTVLHIRHGARRPVSRRDAA